MTVIIKMLLIKDYQIIVRKRIVIIITYLDLKLHPQKCTMFYFSDKLFEKKTFTICFKLFHSSHCFQILII